MIAYVGEMLAGGTKDAVHASGIGAMRFNLEGSDDTRYAHLLQRMWEAGNPFINVEQDIVPDPNVLWGMSRCHHEWCAMGYPVSGRDVFPGIGCMKFSARLIAEQPMAMYLSLYERAGKREWSHWRSCNERIVGHLVARGYRCHRHYPDAQHLHDYSPPQG